MNPELTRRVGATSQSAFSSDNSRQPAKKRAASKDAIPDVHLRERTGTHDVVIDPVTQQASDPFSSVNRPTSSNQLIDVNSAPSWTGWAPQTFLWVLRVI